MKASNAIALTCFALFWTALVGAVDGMIGLDLYRTVRALNFTETTGTILASEVTTHRSSKGRTQYAVAIRYRYEAGTAMHEGDRYRYSGFSSSSNSKWAYGVVRDNPVGAAVKVYYDPADPANAVLSRGLNGGDVFLLLFLTPFNMVMLGLWSLPLAALARKLRPPVAGGVKWFSDGRHTRIRLPRYSPFIAGLVGTGGTAFASIFILAFSTSGNPSLAVGLGTLALAAGVGLSVAGWQWRQQRAGKSDLVLDEIERTVELPLTFGRKQRRTVPVSEISNVTVEAIEHRSRKGGTSHTYAVTLRGNGSEEKLTDWNDEQRAEAFADWLRERLKSGEAAAPPRKLRA